MIQIITAFALVMVYLMIVCLYAKKVPTSISETYYLGGGNIFTLVIAAAGFLLCSGSLTLTTNPNIEFLAFFSGAGLLFVAAAPQFKDDFVQKVHYAGAFIFGVASQLWIVFNYSAWYFLIWSVCPLVMQSKRKMFWIEMICVVNIIFSVIYNSI